MERSMLYWAHQHPPLPERHQMERYGADYEPTEAERAEYDDQFNVDQFYATVAPLTFRTEFVGLTEREVLALMGRYRFEVLHQRDPADDGAADVLAALAARLDAVLQHFHEHSAFVRLTSRSPKDAAFGSAAMRTVLRQELARIDRTGMDAQQIQNAEFAAFFTAQLHSLRVRSGQEALDLLAASERVYEDLSVYERARTSGHHQPAPVRLVLREWHNMRPQFEFRAFVVDRRLTAISQYFDVLYFPDVVQERDGYAQAMQAFFSHELAPLLPYEHCVVDFAVRRVRDEHHGHRFGRAVRVRPDLCFWVAVIEFNPLSRFTGACLFDWRRDADTLFGRRMADGTGTVAPELRVVRRALPVLRAPSEAAVVRSLEGIAPDVLAEAGGVLALLQEHLQDDVARLNGELRYVLAKIRKASLLREEEEEEE